jgi:oligoendopeptidase F
MADVICERSEVAREYTWDAESIFATEQDWNDEFKSIDATLETLGRFQGTLGSAPAALLEWLNTFNEVMRRVQDVYQYAMMFSVVDTADQKAAARSSRSAGLYSRTMAATAFATPEMLQIGMETLRNWMSTEPALAIYAHYFDELEAERPHVRSAEVEQLLGQVQDPFVGPSTVHSLLSDSEIKFKPAVDDCGAEHEVNQMTIHTLLGHADRAVRRTAWENYADGYLAFKNSIANCVAAGVKQDVFQARSRRHATALEASLHAFHCPTEVFHTVIDTYRKHVHIWHRYFDVLRRGLGYDKLHIYDMTAPLSSSRPEVTYAQSIEWICKGMEPLGLDYVTAMRRGLVEDRWVDVYPNRGKNMGAFSSGHQGTRPFIFMSYNDDLFGMSTLAHELGHSMHSYLAWQNQPPVYSGCGSEVPSNFNQAMTRAYLFDTVTDKDFQIALIEEALSNFHRYFLIMPTLARFELEIHTRIEQGGALTADEMNELMAKLFKEAFGDAVEVDHERLGITWAQFPTHIYGNIFMFLYTVGIAGAHALSEPILAGEPGAVQRYLEYQMAGRSIYELDGLKHAGVDMTTPAPIAKTFGVLEKLVDRLESLIC